MTVHHTVVRSVSSAAVRRVPASNAYAAPTLRDQFAVHRDTERPLPAHFVLRRLAGWTLATSPTLPVTPLVIGGTTRGWLLGWAVDADGVLIHTQSSHSLPEVDEPSFEGALYRLRGRWTTVVLEGSAPKVFVDPGASLGAVYDPREQAVASTTSLLRWGEARTFSEERFQSRSLAANEFYPAGLTADDLAQRILPNHFLDLTTWTTVRHWPTAPLHRVKVGEQAALVETIVADTATLIDALSRETSVILPLTSGRDSRMVMAAARSSVHRCEFVTFDYRDWRRADRTYAAAVARRLRLEHHSLPLPAPRPHTRREYLEAIGYDASEGKARDFRSAASTLSSNRGWLTAFAGEVGRGDYWHKTRGDGSPTDMLRRMRQRPNTRNLAAMRTWLDGVRALDLDDQQVMDLMSIEMRVGCWIAPQMYGTAPFAFNVMPLNQRSVYSAMLRQPIEYVESGRISVDVAERAWPELAPLPFGRRPGPLGAIDLLLARYFETLKAFRSALNRLT